jgi:hypothetical protein
MTKIDTKKCFFAMEFVRLNRGSMFFLLFFVALLAEPRSPQGNPDQPDVAFCFMSVLALQL